MTTRTPVPAQVQHWLKELKDPKTPISLRQNYQIMLEDLQKVIDEALQGFSVDVSAATKKSTSKIRSYKV